jgi:chaperonin cofactor prefoldin
MSSANMAKEQLQQRLYEQKQIFRSKYLGPFQNLKADLETIKCEIATAEVELQEATEKLKEAEEHEENELTKIVGRVLAYENACKHAMEVYEE